MNGGYLAVQLTSQSAHCGQPPRAGCALPRVYTRQAPQDPKPLPELRLHRLPPSMNARYTSPVLGGSAGREGNREKHLEEVLGAVALQRCPRSP